MRIIFATRVFGIEGTEDKKVVLSLLPDDHENHDVRSCSEIELVLSAKLAQQLEDGHKVQVDFHKGGPVEKPS